eukprot:TRINITY_DN2374_c0_g1_i1.p1 TRINITY_DN2374_c0_g1~~TRINITY_DN2374_c0_g1_i1.p1  ORF type:complete len:412 (+),score=116.84 TRINITY_DN2374_c0_g1_i1:58-1236(+)
MEGVTQHVDKTSEKCESIRYSRGKLQLLDQLLLPTEIKYVDINNAEEGWSAVRTMKVRGAPALAIAAVLSLAVEAVRALNDGSVGTKYKTPQDAVNFLKSKLDYLQTSRPTAVNLFEATNRLTQVVTQKAEQLGLNDQDSTKVTQVLELYVTEAELMLSVDIETNRFMSDHGAKFLIDLVGDRPLRMLTHCNTGSLATAGYGTALGVIRSLNEKGRLKEAYCTETRPYNQGARLTAFELVTDKIPGSTLVTDSMVAALMNRRGIDAVVVGADRVVANGDTANKVGTFQIAIVAKHHNVPFFVVAPTTTLDVETETGEEITIEERPGTEMTSLNGHQLAPEGIKVWNPAFDVTPHRLITGIVTEKGVIRPQEDGRFDVRAFLKEHGIEPVKRK